MNYELLNDWKQSEIEFITNLTLIEVDVFHDWVPILNCSYKLGKFSKLAIYVHLLSTRRNKNLKFTYFFEGYRTKSK